jgi:hypothetical protein
MLRLMMATKKQIIEKQRLRYQKARKKERTAILTSLALSTELSRDHLARVLRNGYPDRTQGIKGKRGRKPVYGMAHKRLLVSVWTLLYYPSSRRLQAALPDVLAGSSEALRAEYEEKVIQDLLKMSHGTMDRLLKSNRQQVKPFGLSTTKPGSLLKNQIPVRRGTDWDDSRPGFVEIDLVAHCGDSTAGEYLNTLSCTDIASGWTECRAVRNKARTHTLEAMTFIASKLPFPLLGIDSDNGSEFINHHFFYYCQENKLVFTRSRPNHKNDSCYVEQKNWSVVRRFAGYERFEGEEAVELFNRFYEKLSDFNNFFLPSQKLIQRERIGDKVRKKHDHATTPYRRLLMDPMVDDVDKQRLRQKFQSLSILTLRQEMQKLLEQIQSYSLGYSKTKDLATTKMLSTAF